jgi:hypothetical protein
VSRNHTWIKLRWHNLLRSPRVLGFTNKEGCAKETKKWWYLALICEAYFAGGYLPADKGVLWKLADAQTERFFVQHCGEVLACFKSDSDGRRIYHERILELLEDVGKNLHPPPTPSSSLSLSSGFYRRGLEEKTEGANGDSLFARFRAAHPRSRGSQPEEYAFMEACRQDEAEAERIIRMAWLYRQAHEEGTLGHLPAAAVNWLRDKVFNEDPELWKGGGDGRQQKRERTRANIQKAVNGLAE